MRLFDIAGEALWYAKTEGWPFLIRRGARRCFSVVFEFRTCAVFRRNLAAPLRSEPRIDIVARRATPDDLEKLCAIVGPVRRKRFKERFEAGRSCFIAVHRERIIGFIWCSFDIDPRLERIPFNFSLKPDEIYCYDLFVLPEYRRKYVMEKARALRYRLYGERGIKYQIEWAHADNTASFTRGTKIPATEYTLVHCLKVLWFRKSWRGKSHGNCFGNYETGPT